MQQTGRYTVLTGQYQIRHASGGGQPRPDGDTVQFVVDTPATVLGLPRFGQRAPKISATNAVSLRLEVIDALETHFPTLRGSGPEVHQELTLAFGARDFLLKTLGFTNVTFDARGVVVSADALRLPGYVLASGVEANGRIVSLLYAGKGSMADGENVRVSPAQMNSSANLASLAEGMAYATHYASQPQELIVASRAVAAEARRKALGVFGAEAVGVGRAAAIDSVDVLQKLVMFPKLFRRLADYFEETGGTLAGFDAWVRRDSVRDDKLILPSGEVGNLHDVYEVAGNRIELRVQPEDIVVLE